MITSLSKNPRILLICIMQWSPQVILLVISIHVMIGIAGSSTIILSKNLVLLEKYLTRSYNGCYVFSLERNIYCTWESDYTLVVSSHICSLETANILPFVRVDLQGSWKHTWLKGIKYSAF